MLDRLRFLPALIICAALLFGLKSLQFITGVEQHLAGLAHAQTQDEAKENAEMADDDAEMADGEEAVPDALEGGDKEMPAIVDAVEPVFSAAEAAVLASLAVRRAELDQWRRDIDLREQLLRATEKRVEQRIVELKEVEAQVRAYIDDQEQASEEQMADLVKMYENMKPKKAALIFERLDMGILLAVVERMNSRKMAVIMASMDPVAAQELTVELATRRHLPEMLDGPVDPETLPGQG